MSSLNIREVVKIVRKTTHHNKGESNAFSVQKTTVTTKDGNEFEIQLFLNNGVLE